MSSTYSGTPYRVVGAALCRDEGFQIETTLGFLCDFYKDDCPLLTHRQVDAYPDFQSKSRTPRLKPTVVE